MKKLLLCLMLTASMNVFSDLRQELIESVSMNNENNVELALKNGANANATDGTYDRNPALMLAVRAENKDIAELLLKHDANVNTTARDGYTALMLAVLKGNKDIAELLLKYGANINATCKYGSTALEKAIRYGHKDIVELFLLHGVNINAAIDRLGTTFLMCAVGLGTEEHQDIVELLLQYGANVNTTNNDGWSALFHAAFYGYKDAVTFLLKYDANVNAVDHNGRTPLMTAIDKKKNKDIVELLLKSGANINAQDNDLNTALHKAAAFHHKAIAQVLLANDADVNVQNKFGKTVLYDAIKGTFHGGSVKMVELLLTHGVDVNTIVCNQEKLTPLLLAAKLREKEIVKFLLDRDADLNAVDYAGRTAFDIARFDEEIAPLLLKKS